MEDLISRVHNFLAIHYTVQYSRNKTYLIRNCNTLVHSYSDDPVCITHDVDE